MKTYNPKQIYITCGKHIVTGYAEDSFVSIEPNGDGVTKKVGCDGEVARSVSPDDTYTVKISLMQTSASNKFFSKKFKADKAKGNGDFPMEVKDLKGTTLFKTDAAWVTKTASLSYGKEIGNREWELHTGSATLDE